MDEAAPDDCLIVLVTTSSPEQAQLLAETLVTEHHVACANRMGPLTSVYRWQGRVETSEEYLLLLKTTRARFENAAARIRELHSYETPEIVALPIVAGCPDYLSWLRSSLGGGERATDPKPES